MKFRSILTGLLLAFVVVSLAVAVADVAGLRPTVQQVEAAPVSAGDRLIAYYFHTNTRCPTCRAIESNAHAAVAAEVEAGKLDWRVVNYEEPSARHFATEFKLLCPSVILVQMRDGVVTRWKNLERVWELNDDRQASVEYIRAELTAFQEGQP
jgi:hypothetical protein